MSKTEIQNKISNLQRQLADLQSQLQSLPTVPEPENEPGWVIFEKSMGNGRAAKTYKYHAIRTAEGWTVLSDAPGRKPGPKTWDELVEFMAADGPIDVAVVTDYLEVRIEQ